MSRSRRRSRWVSRWWNELVIDTAAAHQVAAFEGRAGSPGGYAPGYPSTGFYGSAPYLYPQPILGKLDDPFYGFEPPVIAYPPWWGGLTGLRLGAQPPALMGAEGLANGFEQVPQQPAGFRASGRFRADIRDSVRDD